MKFEFYEFFAGGGLVRAALERRGVWRCIFANDISESKFRAYELNFGRDGFHHCDIGELQPHNLPGHATLAWVSFPCSDLSVAGKQDGLAGRESRAWHEAWNIIKGLAAEKRMPSVIVIENVPGLVGSNDGADLAQIFHALATAGYRYGPLLIDAKIFVPQSRERLFIVAIRDGMAIPPKLTRVKPSHWHGAKWPRVLKWLDAREQARWIWWQPPHPTKKAKRAEELIDKEDADWDSPEDTQRLLDQMSERHRQRVIGTQQAGSSAIMFAYRRTRPAQSGPNVAVMEVRADDLAGCLRTLGGGSSRQTVVLVEDGEIRSRALSKHEAGRLMGVPDTYKQLERYSEAYDVMADGVVVPVVDLLARSIVEPVLIANSGIETTCAPRSTGGRPRKSPDRVVPPAERSASHREKYAAHGLRRITLHAGIGMEAPLFALSKFQRAVKVRSAKTGGSKREKGDLVQALDKFLGPFGIAVTLLDANEDP